MESNNDYYFFQTHSEQHGGTDCTRLISQLVSQLGAKSAAYAMESDPARARDV